MNDADARTDIAETEILSQSSDPSSAAPLHASLHKKNRMVTGWSFLALVPGVIGFLLGTAALTQNLWQPVLDQWFNGQITALFGPIGTINPVETSEPALQTLTSNLAKLEARITMYEEQSLDDFDWHALDDRLNILERRLNSFSKNDPGQDFESKNSGLKSNLETLFPFPDPTPKFGQIEQEIRSLRNLQATSVARLETQETMFTDLLEQVETTAARTRAIQITVENARAIAIKAKAQITNFASSPRDQDRLTRQALATTEQTLRAEIKILGTQLETLRRSQNVSQNKKLFGEAALLLALTQLIYEASGPAAFANSLAACQSLAKLHYGADTIPAEFAKLLAALKPLATQPTPRLTHLQQTFPPLADAAARASITHPEAEASFIDRTIARLTHLVLIRQIDQSENDNSKYDQTEASMVGDELLLARAETQIKTDDLAGTLETLDYLSQPAADTLDDWIMAARHRYQIETILDALSYWTQKQLIKQTTTKTKE